MEPNMHVEQKIEMKILTQARAAIDANQRQANELPEGGEGFNHYTRPTRRSAARRGY
jgi:hypothetical protein